MKYSKMIGLAAIAVVAAMAFIGASSASATVLCKTNTLPCSSRYPSGTALKAELTGTNEAVLTSGFAVVKCKTSVMEGKTDTEGGETLLVHGFIEKVSWTNCSCNLGGTVTAKAESLPWLAELHWNEKTMNGTLLVFKPRGSFVCAGTECSYTTETASATVLGGEPAVIDAEVKLKLAGGGFLCSGEATWKGTYTVSAPNPLWVAQS